MTKKVQLEREEKKLSKLFSLEIAWALGLYNWRDTEKQGGRPGLTEVWVSGSWLGQFCSPGDIWQHLGRWLDIIAGWNKLIPSRQEFVGARGPFMGCPDQ